VGHCAKERRDTNQDEDSHTIVHAEQDVHVVYEAWLTNQWYTSGVALRSLQQTLSLTHVEHSMHSAHNRCHIAVNVMCEMHGRSRN
jgi:hypothetical protein